MFVPFPFCVLNFPALAASRCDIGGNAMLENVAAVASPTNEVKCCSADAISRIILFPLNSDGVGE